MRLLVAIAIAALSATPSFGFAPHSHRRHHGRHHSVVSMSTKQSGPGLDAMVAGAAAVASAVSKDVSMKTLEAPETSRSFVALDRNDTGTVDKSGLPLVS